MIDIRVLKNKAFKKEQLKVFLITVILYCTWHAARTAWAYSKSSVKKSDHYLTDQKLGVLDMCFMLAYASGLFFNGWLGDKSDLKSFIIIGSVISLSGYYTFALLARNEFYNTLIFAICFLLHGFGQSRGFPGNIAILGNWVEPSKRGFLLGLWNASINIGNIMGQQIGRLTIETFEGNWTTALFIAGGTMIVMSFVLYFYLQDSPKKAGLEIIPEDPSRQEVSREVEVMDASVLSTSQYKSNLKFSEVWETPGLIRYCLVFVCIKGSTYGLLFWLPDYLQSVLHFGQSTSVITATYEFGQFLGAIALGYYSDHLGKRSTVIVVALYISAALFSVLAYLGVDCTVYSFGIIIFFAGIFFGGPEAIVGGVVSSDLGEGVTMNKDVRSMSTMAGVIDGSGSIGAAVIQLIIPYFKTSSFYIYFILCLLAAFLLTPSLIADVKKKLAG